MRFKPKKIAIIFNTGTALSSTKRKTVVFVERKEDMLPWLGEIPEISVMAQIDPIFLQKESLYLSEERSVDLAKLIVNIHEQYDGIVVLTSADTLIRESILVSYMCGFLDKPIVFTGAPFTMKALEEGKLGVAGKNFSGLGLKSNVINAVQVATKDFKRVAIMYGNRLLDPIKTQRTGLSDLNIFDTVDKKYWGKVEFSIRIDEKQKVINNLSGQNIGLSSAVLSVDPAELAMLSDEAINTFKILIVKISENQKLSNDEQGRLQRVKPVVLAYNFWYVLDQGRIHTISGITEDALLAKCRWLAGIHNEKEDIVHGLQKSYLGEATIV